MEPETQKKYKNIDITFGTTENESGKAINRCRSFAWTEAGLVVVRRV